MQQPEEGRVPLSVAVKSVPQQLVLQQAQFLAVRKEKPGTGEM